MPCIQYYLFHFFPHASISLLCIRFIADAFQSDEPHCQTRSPSASYFFPPWADMAKAQTDNTCGDHKHFVSTKFHQHQLSISGEAENIKCWRTDDGQTEEWTKRDDNSALESLAKVH